MSKNLPINDDFRFDVRVMPHALRRGKLAQADVDAHIAALPDDAEEAEPCEVVFTTPFADRLAREAAEAAGE